MDSFLALAEELQLEGLEGNSGEKVPKHPTETSNHTERGAEVNQKQNMPKKQMSSHAKFGKESVVAIMVPSEQNLKTNTLIEPATMTKN